MSPAQQRADYVARRAFTEKADIPSLLVVSAG
jgi:hypothetical protein